MLYLRQMFRFTGSMEARRGISLLCKVQKTRLFAFTCFLFVAVYSGFQLTHMPVKMDICPYRSSAMELYHPADDDNITIVTMYVNLGSFKKSSFFGAAYSYQTEDYRSWLLSWGKLRNPVIAFFDDDEFIQRLRKLRSHLPENYTRIVKISREQLPAFQQRKRIEEIIANPSFKVSYPSQYTCAMYAKYDVMEMALKMGGITTKYIAWMDVGLWRKIQEEDPPFVMNIPPNFNSSKVGFTEVSSRSLSSNMSPKEIYQENIVWVAGGFVLGTKQVLAEFTRSFKETAQELLVQGLADTDQQVVASMYSPALAWRQKIEVMTYACPRGAFGLFGYSYLYFCLPYICRASAECKTRPYAHNNHLLSQSIHGA